MSGIYIPKIHLPENAEGCDVIIRIQPDGEVLTLQKIHLGIKAVPVPDHGRLVDADELCKVLKALAADEWNQGTAPFSWAYAYDCMADTVDTMPTVIPKEEP